MKKGKMPPFPTGKESKKEEKAEKKLPPAAYKKVERAEGEKMKKGGMVRGKKC